MDSSKPLRSSATAEFGIKVGLQQRLENTRIFYLQLAARIIAGLVLKNFKIKKS